MLDVSAGSNIIRLNNRVDLKQGKLLRIGVGSDQEFARSVTAAALPNPSPGNAPPNAGNVVLRDPCEPDIRSEGHDRPQTGTSTQFN